MNLPKSNLLVIEDDPRMAEVLESLLGQDPVILQVAKGASEAWKLIGEASFDLILLDLGLPGTNGLDLLRRLKMHPQTASVPVVVVTAWNSTNDKLKAFEFGATDYVTKPFEPAELHARLCAVLRAK